jgi:hypothetical protein
VVHDDSVADAYSSWYPMSEDELDATGRGLGVELLDGNMTIKTIKRKWPAHAGNTQATSPGVWGIKNYKPMLFFLQYLAL